MDSGVVFMKSICINAVLAKWNPLDAPDEIADVEYMRYVPQILKYVDDVDKIAEVLEKIAHEDLGLDDPTHEQQNRMHAAEYARKIYDEVKMYT